MHRPNQTRFRRLRGRSGAAGPGPENRTAREAGFSLLELCVVLVIVGVIAAIAAPQLLPLIAFSELDGEARRLANFGTAVVAEAALFKEPVLVRFDLKTQEYWAVHLVYPEPEAEGEGGGPMDDQMGMLRDFQKSSGMSSSDMSNLLAAKGPAGNMNAAAMQGLPEGFDAEAADSQMNDKFGRFARATLESRARNVKHEEGFLDEIGPLFEKEFTLDEDQPVEEELGGVLGRRKIPEGVRLEAVSIDGGKGRGVVEIEVSPIGLPNMVGFHFVNTDGEYMTVYWDSLTGRGAARSGRTDI